MSKNITKEINAEPFFARFLEEQAAQQEETPQEEPPSETEEQGSIWTIKWPSDWEDL